MAIPVLAGRAPVLLRVAAAAATLGLASLAPMVLRAYYVDLLSTVLIFAIFAMSINLLGGWLGLVSLGHAGIMAATGYGVGYVASQQGTYGHQLLVGIALGVGTSLVFGLLAMRTSGVSFLMITLALGMVV